MSGSTPNLGAAPVSSCVTASGPNNGTAACHSPCRLRSPASLPKPSSDTALLEGQLAARRTQPINRQHRSHLRPGLVGFFSVQQLSIKRFRFNRYHSSRAKKQSPKRRPRSNRTCLIRIRATAGSSSSATSIGNSIAILGAIRAIPVD